MVNIRNRFYTSLESSDAAHEFITYLNKLPNKNEPIIRGYTGMGYMLLAKHAFNPYNKLSNFNTGKNILEKAVESDMENTELRFLRLSVQMNAPFFLNYSDKVKEDKEKVLSGFKYVEDSDLKKKIREFLVDNKIPVPENHLRIQR